MGLFGKKKGLVGVDIGSSAVKAVELKVGGKGGDEYQLLNIGLEPLPPEAIVDGAIMDSGAVIDAVQNLFQDNRIKTTDVATGVSGNAVIVKKISLPQMSEEELAESIHWEAEQYIPFDIQDVALDYEVVEGGARRREHGCAARGRQEGQDQRVHVGDHPGRPQPDGRRRRRLRPAELLRGQLRSRSRPGGRAAQHRRLHHEHQRGEGWLLDLQPGHRGGGQPVHGCHPEGSQPLLRAGRGPQAGRARSTRPPPRASTPILQAVSENIATEIQRTFDFFRATSQEDRVDQIYLSGGAANVHGLRDLLADRLDAPVELLNPFLNVRYNEKDFDPAFLDDIGPSAAIAVGLAVRRVGDR